MEWLTTLSKEFYIHFSACKAYENTDNPALKNSYAETAESLHEYGLGFNMKMNCKPTMVWDFNSLKVTIETVYAFLISQPDTPLRMCKHCGKAFYATHGRSEFCDSKCHNQYNVYKFRKIKVNSFYFLRSFWGTIVQEDSSYIAYVNIKCVAKPNKSS